MYVRTEGVEVELVADESAEQEVQLIPVEVVLELVEEVRFLNDERSTMDTAAVQ